MQNHKTILAAMAIAFASATSFAAPAALAQTTTTPTTPPATAPDMPPSPPAATTPPPATTAPTTAAPGGSFVTTDQANQWLASRLIGMTVYGPDDASIGEVDDLLVDPSGRVVAAVVGVGGFLGIGEKSVAISFDRLRPMQRDGKDRVTVSLTKADLEAAPAFRHQDRT